MLLVRHEDDLVVNSRLDARDAVDACKEVNGHLTVIDGHHRVWTDDCRQIDVVHIDNERLQNYDETIIVLRNPEWEGAQALAATLKTKNVLVLLNKNATVDAIVHTGRDFQQIVEPDQGEKNDSK